MKKILIGLAAIPAAIMAVEASAQTYANTASAQTYANTNASVTIQNQVAQLQGQLDAGIQSRSIDATEARSLRQQIRQLNRLQRQYSANGFTQQEWNTLQQRVGIVNQQMQSAGGYAYGQAGNGYTYGNNGFVNNNGYAYGNSNVTYDQYGRRIVNPGYGYSQPVTNGYYGQGGPYVPPPQNNGIGGVLGNVLGSGGGNILGSILSNGGLRIGDVVSGVIGNVLGRAPSTSYQSSGNTYFRTDGQRVYEIDARTNQVVRIHPAR